MAVGHALKQSVVALGEAQRQQSLREIKRRFLRRSQETRNLRRTPEQWQEVQRRSQGPPRDITEIRLDSKALLNPKETLSALYVSQMWLQGHKYCIRDDPIRWAHFRRYLQLLPQHAPPARTNYVQPRHLWEVQSGKARGLDLRLPEADVCIDISWYRHLTEADQYTLCVVMRSPGVLHSGQAWSGHAAPQAPQPAGPIDKPPRYHHLLQHLQAGAYGFLSPGDSNLRAGPRGPMPRWRYAGAIPPGGGPHSAHEAGPREASAPGGGCPDH